jgi:LysM repeat protein
MPARSPARWLAPVALVTCAVAVFAIVSSGPSDDAGTDGATTSERPASQRSTSSQRRRSSSRRSTRRRAYTVRAGDTLSAIAEKTDVPLSELQALNPDLDSQSLQTGQRVKLAP